MKLSNFIDRRVEPSLVGCNMLAHAWAMFVVSEEEVAAIRAVLSRRASSQPSSSSAGAFP